MTCNGENSIKYNSPLSCAETNNASQLVCDNLERGEKIERKNSITSPNVTINGDVSLQNLSNAIQNRKKISESNTSPENSKQKSRSSLVESINNVDKMLSKLLELGRSEIAKRYEVHLIFSANPYTSKNRGAPKKNYEFTLLAK